MSQALFVHGAKLRRGDARLADTPTMTLIPAVQSFGLPVGYSVDALDATNQDSPDFTREYIAGLADKGTIQAVLHYNHTLAGHQALQTIPNGRAVVAYEIELPKVDSTSLAAATFEFNGFIETMGNPEVTTGDLIEVTIDVRIADSFDFTPEA